MDNLSKALYMAIGALLFIVAMTASIILYSRIIDFANTSIIISDLGDRAESVRNSTLSPKREIKRSEVVTSIMQINSLAVSKIDVDCGSVYTFKPSREGYMEVDGKRDEQEINNYSFTDIIKGTYKMSYNYSTNSITYKLLEKDGD